MFEKPYNKIKGKHDRMDIHRVERIVAEFAKTYHFLEWKDIANVVTKSKPMFTKKQLQMDGKTYVDITKHTEKDKDKHYVLLYIGKIDFNLDSSYSVDTDRDGFVINVSDFSDEQTLIDTMIEKCKEYNHL
jgi:hypothetical protein